jgi:hypothetical protein
MSVPVQRLSDKSYELILQFEVGGGRPYYEKNLASPTWPGKDSGVTIGIGYDCGYNDPETIEKDWTAAGISSGNVAKLMTVSGVKGKPAKALLPSLSGLGIPWDTAWFVFNETSVPKFIRMTLRAFPSAAEKLPADAFGALVSLVFNRGGKMEGKSRVQMLNIRNLILSSQAGPQLQRGIATQIRAMIPIWRFTGVAKGMARRRNAEADLVVAGLE